MAVRAALRAPHAFFRVALAATVAVGAWTAAVVNLRWEPWLAVCCRTAIYDPSADLPLWAMNLMLVALYLGIGGRRVWLDRRHGSTA